MNGLIKQLLTANCPLAQLSEHKTNDLRRTYWHGFELRIQGVLQKFCFNFHK